MEEEVTSQGMHVALKSRKTEEMDSPLVPPAGIQTLLFKATTISNHKVKLNGQSKSKRLLIWNYRLTDFFKVANVALFSSATFHRTVCGTLSLLLGLVHGQPLSESTALGKKKRIGMDTKLKSFTCDKIHLMIIILTEVGALSQSTCSGVDCYSAPFSSTNTYGLVYTFGLYLQERTRFGDVNKT